LLPVTKIQMSELAGSGGSFRWNKVDLDQIAARWPVVV